MKYSLVLDSGVGGISILKECVKLLPNEHFLYVADNEHLPYGNKSRKNLNQIAYRLILKLVKEYPIKLILIACNTLTASSISYLRSKINLPFVGVEPAIKPAMLFGKGNILVLSTKATLKYNQNLKKIMQKKPKNIYFLTFSHLAQKIDENLKNLDVLEPYLTTLFLPYQNKNIQSVVLGCTHYQFIKKQICVALQNPKLNFFESSIPVAKRVESVLKEQELNQSDEVGSITILCTKKDVLFEQKLKEYLI